MRDPNFPDSPSGQHALELAEHWGQHVLALIDHHQRVGQPLSGDELRVHAMEALNAGQELTEALDAWRPVLACEALATGAGCETVSSVIGLDEGRFANMLARWAREQRTDGRITHARFQEIMALAGYTRADDGGAR